MPANGCIGRDPIEYRDVAEKLRGIAREVRFDHNRVNQLLALAEGFDRLAQRLEDEEALADEKADWPGSLQTAGSSAAATRRSSASNTL